MSEAALAQQESNVATMPAEPSSGARATDEMVLRMLDNPASFDSPPQLQNDNVPRGTQEQQGQPQVDAPAEEYVQVSAEHIKAMLEAFNRDAERQLGVQMHVPRPEAQQAEQPQMQPQAQPQMPMAQFADFEISDDDMDAMSGMNKGQMKNFYNRLIQQAALAGAQLAMQSVPQIVTDRFAKTWDGMTNAQSIMSDNPELQDYQEAVAQAILKARQQNPGARPAEIKTSVVNQLKPLISLAKQLATLQATKNTVQVTPQRPAFAPGGSQARVANGQAQQGAAPKSRFDDATNEAFAQMLGLNR